MSAEIPAGPRRRFLSRLQPRLLRLGLVLGLLAGLLVVAELTRPDLLRNFAYGAYYRAASLVVGLRGGPPARPLNPEVVHLGDFVAPAALPPDRRQAVLLASGSTWRLLEDGTDPGPTWREAGFDDSAWLATHTPLQAGPVHPGPGLPVTVYLRAEFQVDDPAMFRQLDLELLRDDGALVYLNGSEVWRSNLPPGAVTAQTPARSTVLGSLEHTYFHQVVDAARLQAGRNVLAVELHQAAAAHMDRAFDLVVRGALRPASTRFAVIGDFGSAGPGSKAVANLVKSWSPDFILTTGDNNYPSGEARTIDRNVGQYYHAFLSPYLGRHGPGADQNRFFPTLGNHDWGDVADAPGLPQAYLDYFTLPQGQGDERYYDFQWGPVHVFALDSDPNEPDGITAQSVQAAWLQAGLQQSESFWKLVVMHHPPFSSTGVHPPTGEMDWPYAEWGASLVLSGHDHFYERIERGGLPYLVNGLGGGDLYALGQPVEGSQVRFTGQHGAILVQAGPCNLQAWFITIEAAVIDSFQLANPAAACLP